MHIVLRLLEVNYDRLAILVNDLNGSLRNIGCKFIQIDTKEVIDLSYETDYSIFLCTKKVKEDKGLCSKPA